MIGRLLNTLSYHANKMEREWKSQNKLRQEYSYGFLKKILFFLARNPLRWSGIFLLLFGLATFCVTKFQLIEIKLIPSKLNKPDLLIYFTTIWGVQTTIAALIYPIVISFISLLLQKRNDARSYLNIYLHDTASIFSGLSSLFLVIMMTVLFLLIPTIEEQVLLNWVYICALYLLTNLILVTYFLYQTFLYIRPRSRKENLKKYLINETWPNDLKELLRLKLFQRAADEEELLKFEELHTYPVVGKKLALVTHDIYKPDHILFDDYFSINLSKKARLEDVRLFFLRLACKRWAKKAIYSDSVGNNLVIKLMPGRYYSDSVQVCKVQGYNEITFLQKLFFRLSFKFKRITSDTPLDVDSVLQDLKAEVFRSLQSRDLQGFNESLGDLREFIVLLIKSSHTEQINYSAIRSNFFWGGPQYEQWIGVLNQIFERASKVLGENRDFVTEILYEPRLIYREIEDIVEDEVKFDIALLYKKIAYQVDLWWINKIENLGATNHSLCSPVKLNPPYQTIYLGYLSDFLGEWEQIKNRNFLPSNFEKSDWDKFSGYTYLLKNHLNTTIKLLVSSLNTGNVSQSEYMLDTLLKWHEGLRGLTAPYSGRVIEDSDFINERLIELNWLKVQSRYDLSVLRFKQERDENIIFSLAIYHLWIDHCSIFLFWLARQYLKCKDQDQSLIVNIYKRLITGDHPLKTGSNIIHDPKPVSGVEDCFEAVLRIYYSGFDSSLDYRSSVNSYIRSVYDQFHIDMIGGRSYSGSGGEAVYTMREGILLTLLVLISGKWNPSIKYESRIEKWLKSDVEKVTNLKNDLSEWIDRIDSDDFNKYETFYKNLQFKADLSFDIVKAHLVDGLKTFRDKIDQVSKELIINTELDESKLDEIEKWSSSKVLDSMGKKFPASFFERIEFTEEKLNVSTFTFHKCKRGWFMNPVLVTGGPDQQLYEGLLIDEIPQSIWDISFKKFQPEEANFKTDTEYWEQIKEFERVALSKNKAPVLILDYQEIPDWIFSWINEHQYRGYEKPSDLTYVKDESIRQRSYQGHINKTEVHIVRTVLGFKGSLLTTKESFKLLKLTKLKENKIISLEVEGTEIDEEVDLNFIWSFEVEIEKNDAALLNHINLKDQ